VCTYIQVFLRTARISDTDNANIYILNKSQFLDLWLYAHTLAPITVKFGLLERAKFRKNRSKSSPLTDKFIAKFQILTIWGV